MLHKLATARSDGRRLGDRFRERLRISTCCLTSTDSATTERAAWTDESGHCPPADGETGRPDCPWHILTSSRNSTNATNLAIRHAQGAHPAQRGGRDVPDDRHAAAHRVGGKDDSAVARAFRSAKKERYPPVGCHELPGGTEWRLAYAGEAPACIRQGDGMTQSEFTARLDVSKQHLSHIENSRKVVSPERAAC